MVAELWRLAMGATDSQANLGAVLVIDLDHFKSVNDRYGHNAGDDVLVDLSRRLRASLRKSDLLSRYGGEEFVVLLPGADLAVARMIAERIGQAVQGQPCLQALDGVGVRVTASIGVGLIRPPQPEQSPEQFARDTVAAADAALRAAKMGGRNRIMAESSAAFA
jgi:two-component system cell cycle response regulator